ncbi:Homeobox-leucine zipper protein ATHB-21 [Morus notabilis]|uniref:Homeobox-leucine zipper protein n=1 Tax=Morus notabilis TaxID=981085 RepID=W9R304_9ROSA|nr:homeobox-leucine zipper protein ATHB-40 [Morus notabilis]EXB54950.1 Homeobox-leucine zipper protein ATHB-21 [Morus notabilis]
MDFHYIQTQDSSKLQQRSRRLTQAQVRLLETSFTTDHKLQAERKFQLATSLGMSPRQLAIWYQNRRARQKTQTIEFDYRTIQLRLEDVLAEKRRLEKEVVMLKHELNKAQQMQLLASSGAVNSAANSDLPSVAVSAVDDHASSSSLHNYSYGEENNVAQLQVEELYTCLSPWP